MRNPELDEARLEFLQWEFFTNTGAPKAVERYRKLLPKPPKLDHLLRYHVPIGVDGAEVTHRDQFDDLLTYYAIRELAAISGYVGVDANDPTLSGARELLSNPSIRRYYTQHYPLLLPRLFRLRLSGQWHLTLDESPGTDAVVEDMLTMTRAAAKDEALETFLWYLDDGWQGAKSLDNVIEDVFAKPKRLVECLGTAYDADEDDNGVVGFARFLEVCARHDAMFRMIKDPVLKAALWHLNGYWYEILGDRLKPVVHKAQAAARQWKGRTDREPLPDFEAVVQRVTDRKVGRPLDDKAPVNA